MTRPQEQRSLFGEILDWMLAPLLLLWPMSVAVTWFVAQNIANRPYDRELGDLLRSLSRQVQVAAPAAPGQAPQVIEDNMEQGRRGLRDGQGFLNYDGMDVAAYQQGRLDAFAAMLRHLGKLPVKG